MNSIAFFALALAAFVLVVVPVLAISAFVRTRRLDTSGGAGPHLLQRLASIQRQLTLVEQRLAQLEQKPAAAAAAEPSPEVRPVVPPPRPAEAAVPAPPPPRTTALQPGSRPAPPPVVPEVLAGKGRSSRLDLETLIAGRWLNRVGILALLFAVSFFLKYAFENNWVGPRGRVAIGLLLGSALFPWSQWLLRRGYRYFSEGIAGLGAAVLYLSIWSGWHYYKLFPQGSAFAGMIVVTAAMVSVAVGRDSQRVALLALVGGFLTPLLVSTGRDQQVVLFTYLGVLDAGLLALARARNWILLAPISFVATEVYFWGWYETFYNAEKLERTALFATLFFVVFAALPVVRSQRDGRLSALEMGLVLLNAFGYLVALRAMLWHEHRWALTVAVLALAAVHLEVARRLPRPQPSERAPLRLLFAGLALTFVSLAIPIRLEGKWITMAWAVEGAVLIWSGIRAKTRSLRAAGLLLFAVAAVRLAMFPIPAPQFLLNARFAAFSVAVASFGAALYFARREPVDLTEAEKTVFAVLGIVLNAYALAALSLEAWDLFGRMRAWDIESSLSQQLSLSVVWTAYATGLIVAGVKRRAAALRWQALALFGLVVAKVFLYDLSFLERFYRIVSFLVLGLVLLVVSFFYQRKLAADRDERQT